MPPDADQVPSCCVSLGPEQSGFWAGASSERLRFKAAIKSITGGGVENARGLIAINGPPRSIDP
jgi:hypothetical protein